MVTAREKALRLLWTDKCTVTVKQERRNPANKRTEFVDMPLVENEPCKLSFSSVTSAAETGQFATVAQGVKLILSPTVEVPAGAKIAVERGGKKYSYSRSGEPAVFTCHQEIELVLWEGRA